MCNVSPFMGNLTHLANLHKYNENCFIITVHFFLCPFFLKDTRTHTFLGFKPQKPLESFEVATPQE